MQEEFQEQQRFNQWWLILILAGLVLIALFGFLQQVIFDKPFGNNPAPNGFLIGFLMVTIVFNLWFFSIKLQTKINSRSIDVSFGIFGKKRVDWINVKKAEVVDYGFIGGWGLRYSKNYGQIFSIRGSKGLHVRLKNGSQFVIGTQRKNELIEYLNTLTNSNT